jgi:hypothetical protein
MACECTKDSHCDEGKRLWGLVENAWNNLVATGDFRPAIIDGYHECWADYREHRKNLTTSSK